MPFNHLGPGAEVPVDRIYPIHASDIGDDTAGGDVNLKTYADDRRWLYKQVADIAARNALGALADGTNVEVLDDGTGSTALHVYRTSGGWQVVAGGGSGGSSGAIHVAARMATTAALVGAYTYASGVITFTANGTFPNQDGVTPVQGDRVFLKDEPGGLAPYNGLYGITVLGDGTHKAVLTRVADADTSAEVLPATVIWVAEGTLNQDTEWVLTTNAPITLGTTSLAFARFFPGGAMSQLMPCTPATGDGSNKDFTLPGSGSFEMVFAGGAPQPATGASQSYTRAGQVISFATAPANGTPILASTSVAPLAGTDALTLQTHAAAYFLAATAQAVDSAELGGVAAASYALKSNKPFFRCVLDGDLSQIPAGQLPARLNPYLNQGAKTLAKIVIYCPASGTGTLTLDILKKAIPGGGEATLYTTNAGSKPSLTGNSGFAYLVINVVGSAANDLPSTVALADMDLLTPEIVTVPNNTWNDLVIEFYE